MLSMHRVIMHGRTNRAVFAWQEHRQNGGMVSYEDRASTWNSGVQKVTRRGSAEEEVRKHRDSCNRSLGTNQQTKTTNRCKLWSEYGNGFTAWYMDGWGGSQKDFYQGEENKGRHPPASVRYMGSGLHAETGCRKVYAGAVFDWQKIPEYLQNTHQKIFKICIKRSSKYVSKYLNIYLQNSFQNLQNSFQKHKNLVHPLQTCVFLSKPKFTLIEKSAPPEASVFHSRQGYFRQKCSHKMARQTIRKVFTCQEPRRKGGTVMELWRSNVDVEQWGAEGD